MLINAVIILPIHLPASVSLAMSSSILWTALFKIWLVIQSSYGNIFLVVVVYYMCIVFYKCCFASMYFAAHWWYFCWSFTVLFVNWFQVVFTVLLFFCLDNSTFDSLDPNKTVSFLLLLKLWNRLFQFLIFSFNYMMENFDFMMYVL